MASIAETKRRRAQERQGEGAVGSADPPALPKRGRPTKVVAEEKRRAVEAAERQEERERARRREDRIDTYLEPEEPEIRSDPPPPGPPSRAPRNGGDISDYIEPLQALAKANGNGQQHDAEWFYREAETRLGEAARCIQSALSATPPHLLDAAFNGLSPLQLEVLATVVPIKTVKAQLGRRVERWQAWMAEQRKGEPVEQRVKHVVRYRFGSAFDPPPDDSHLTIQSADERFDDVKGVVEVLKS